MLLEKKKIGRRHMRYKVSINILHLPVGSVDSLQKRVAGMGLLPQHWITLSSTSDGYTVCRQSSRLMGAYLLVTVHSDLTVTVKVDGRVLENLNINLSPNTVSDYIQILSSLDNMTFCSGNTDQKFMELSKCHDGSFKNNKGNDE